MAYGVALNLYNMLVPFAMRTAMIYFMGIQYLGLNSLFTSILQVLNMAELGVGSAMVYSMYKPIAEDDDEAICALLKRYRYYYRVIGAVIAVAGIALLPVLPKLIKNDYPSDVNIYYLYILNLSATVLSYWLYAYKNSILDAYQRTDLASKVAIRLNTVQYIIQLLVIIFLKNYYCYVIVLICNQIVKNLVVANIVNKQYPQYHPIGGLPESEIKAINQRIKDLFTSKVGAIVVNSADTIVISAFLGLTILAVYQNYYFIMSSVLAIITIVFKSLTAGIGNSLVVESKEKNYNDLETLTFIMCWIAGICVCCFLNCYQPFMKLWVGEDLMLDYAAIICLAVYFFIYVVNQLLNVYKDAGGIWHADRFRPLITALTNLAMNLCMVQFWGIYGIILSTVLSMLVVGMPWLLHNLFTNLFDKKLLYPYLKKLLIYVIFSGIVAAFSWLICKNILLNALFTIIVRLVVSFIFPNVCFIIVYHKNENYNKMLRILDKMLDGRVTKCLGKLLRG